MSNKVLRASTLELYKNIDFLYLNSFLKIQQILQLHKDFGNHNKILLVTFNLRQVPIDN